MILQKEFDFNQKIFKKKNNKNSRILEIVLTICTFLSLALYTNFTLEKLKNYDRHHNLTQTIISDNQDIVFEEPQFQDEVFSKFDLHDQSKTEILSKIKSAQKIKNVNKKTGEIFFTYDINIIKIYKSLRNKDLEYIVPVNYTFEIDDGDYKIQNLKINGESL
jgi:hypothetical protein